MRTNIPHQLYCCLIVVVDFPNSSLPTPIPPHNIVQWFPPTWGFPLVAGRTEPPGKRRTAFHHLCSARIPFGVIQGMMHWYEGNCFLPVVFSLSTSILVQHCIALLSPAQKLNFDPLQIYNSRHLVATLLGLWAKLQASHWRFLFYQNFCLWDAQQPSKDAWSSK